MGLFSLTIPDGDPRLPLPPLPPPSPVIASILEAVRERMTGRVPVEHSCDMHFNLLRDQLADLWKHLQADGDDQQICRYFDDKAHFDYFTRDETFILRMHTYLHAAPCAELYDKIRWDMYCMGLENPSLRDILKRIVGACCATSELSVPRSPDGALSYHSPNEQFLFLYKRCPTVIIEISYTKQPRRLTQLAYDYIAGTDGETRAVIGLEHRHGALVEPKRATVKVWRPEIKIDDDGQEYGKVALVHKEDFRDKHGNPCPGSLTLPLTDFVRMDSDAAIAAAAVLEASVRISYAELCKYLSDAEMMEKLQEKQAAFMRGNSSTPAEADSTDGGDGQGASSDHKDDGAETQQS